MSYKVDVAFNNFSMGLNNRDANNILQNAESPELRSIVLGKRGAFESRQGLARYRTAAVDTKPVTSIYEHITAGVPVFLAAAGTLLRRADALGWTTLMSTFTDGQYFDFITNTITGKCLFVNGKDGYFETDGTTCAAVVPYSPTYAEVVEIGYNALGQYTSYAELTTNLSGDNNDLRYIAKTAGPPGRDISIRYVRPATANQPLSVSVVTNAITVNLATDAGSNVTTTANHILNAIVGTAAAHALVHVSLKSGETGVGIVTAMDATFLSGGGEFVRVITDPRLILYHKNRVWLANLSAHPDRVYFSGNDINGNIRHDYFPTTNWIRSANQRGEEVTGIVSYRDSLYIFTQSTIRVLVGDVPPDFRLEEVSLTVGTVSGRSIVEGAGNLFFLGPDGIYVFNGTSAPRKISQRIPMTVRNISKVHRNRCAGISVHEKYYLSIPESTVNDITLEYDTDVVVPDYIGEKAGLASNPWTLHRGFIANDWLIDRDENVYIAGNDGFVYQYGIGHTDGGVKIDSYYITKGIDLDMPSRLKRFREIFIDIDYEFSSGFMTIEYMADNSEWKQLTEVNLSNKDQNRFAIGKLCRRIAFKFSNTYTESRFRLLGFTLDVAVRGHQSQAERD